MSETRYLVNPDVSCREEEPDGAILFNPDTDAVRAINKTGLLLWRRLTQPATKHGLTELLVAACEEANPEQAMKDVNDFIDGLRDAGFIGTVPETDDDTR